MILKHLDWRRDIIILLALLILAAPPRLIALDRAIYGLHGDEAWTGIDARRVLDEGFIEPYVGSATGQPTGPLYLTALVFALFGESVATLRLSMALYGIATVLLLYILLRLFFTPAISALVTVSFAFLLMHLHFSRLGFMVISAPVFQLLGLICLVLAVRRRNLWWTSAGGLWIGLGLYSYNAFLAFPPLVFAYLLYLALARRAEQPFWRVQPVVFAVVFLITTAPLTEIMITAPDFYFSRHRHYSILNLPELRDVTAPLESASILVEHVANKLGTFVLAGHTDGVDGFGTFHNFLPLQLLLIAAGIGGVIAARRREGLVLLLLGSALLFSATLTFEGVYRRQMLTLVPLFFLMAYGLQFLLEQVSQWRNSQWRAGMLAALFLIVALESGYSLWTYWNRVVPEPGVRRVLVGDLVQTLNTHEAFAPPDAEIILFTDGFYCTHETIRFMLGERPCQGGRDADYAEIFAAPPAAPVTLVFLPPYHDYIDHATAWAQQGERLDVTDNGRLVSILYRVD